MISVDVNRNVAPEEWRAYVEHHPQGLAYHLPEWKDTLQQSLRRQPLYIFAHNEQGRLAGLLPLFQVDSPLTGNRLVSLPFSHTCGPIADTESIEASLIGAAKELCKDRGCRYLEIRAMRRLSTDMKVSDYFSTYVLELSEDPSTVWKRLHQKSIRWAIGKAKRDGVTVRIDASVEGLRTFNGLNQRTKRNLGVPAHPFVLLCNMSARLRGQMTLYLAEIEGRAIAGMVTISFKDGICYAYGASDERYLRYHANDLLIWQAIEDGCNKGYRWFDFGKTAPDNQGLARFKKHWGTEQKGLYYHYHPFLPSLISSQRSGWKYRFLTGLWKKLPLPLAEAMGSVAFRHLD